MRTLITLAILTIATTAHADWVITLDLEAETTLSVNYPIPTIPPVEDDHRLGASGTITLSDDLSTITELNFNVGHITSDGGGYFPWQDTWQVPRDLGGLGFALNDGDVFIVPGSPGGTTFTTYGSSRWYMYLNGDGPKFEQLHPFGWNGNTHGFSEYTEPFPLTPYGYRLGTIHHLSECIPEPSSFAALLVSCFYGYGRRTRRMGE